MDIGVFQPVALCGNCDLFLREPDSPFDHNALGLRKAAAVWW
jgi:hypothetical protein